MEKTRVLRTSSSTAPVVRHRRCQHCNLDFRTTESIALSATLKVVKAGNRGTEPYNRRKLADTLSWLSRRDKISNKAQEAIVLELEYRLLQLAKRDVISTDMLAELLFKGLMRQHPDAARRFAARYMSADGKIEFRRHHHDAQNFDRAASGQLDLFTGKV